MSQLRFKSRLAAAAANYLSFALLAIGFILIVTPARAAELIVQAPSREVPVSGQLDATVTLKNSGLAVNAVAGQITWPAELLELQDIRDGDSIVNFWLERPQVIDGKIIFSGIIPGGYSGPGASLFSLIFQSKAPGSGTITISQAQVLLNDGQGGAATTTLTDLAFLSSNEVTASSTAAAASTTAVALDDREAPEPFTPLIATDSAIYSGRNFLVFATQDKGSGVDHYEVQEGNRPWRTAISPYLLQNQNLDATIRVKAVDRSGNELVVSLPAHAQVWYNNYWLTGLAALVVILLVGLALALAYRLIRRLRKIKRS